MNLKLGDKVRVLDGHARHRSRQSVHPHGNATILHQARKHRYTRQPGTLTTDNRRLITANSLLATRYLQLTKGALPCSNERR